MFDQKLPLQRQYLQFAIKEALGSKSQSQIASITRFSEKRISLWFNHDDPSDESLKQISRSIHTSTDYETAERIADSFVATFSYLRDIESRSTSPGLKPPHRSHAFLQKLGLLNARAEPTEKLIEWLRGDQENDLFSMLEVPSPTGQLYHYTDTAVDVVGRIEEQEALERFRDAGPGFRWWQIAGAGGQGKSRLA